MADQEMQLPSTPPPQRLPKLRKGLTVNFSDYDLDGKPQWLIHDAGRSKFFIIGWIEYEIFKRWHLETVEAIIESVTNETTLQIDDKDVENLTKFLGNHFLFKQTGYQIGRSAKEQHLFRGDNLLQWIIDYYLFFRIPLWHPDKFLCRTKIVADIVFSKYLFYVMSVLAVLGIYQLGMQWDDFTHTFSSLVTFQGAVLYMFVFAFCKLFHELGHAYMCRRYGVPVPTLGVAFLVFFPVLYTDTTLSWSLNSKSRMRIALAGMWVETYITIIATLIWCNTTNVSLQSVCYLVVAVNWMASLIINVSPFMRFDGYYVLADFLKMPNFQPRAFALARWQLRRWLFGWDDPPPEQFSKHLHNILVIYSFITWIYRLTLYVGIAFLVYHFFIKIVGIILFLIELHYFILAPFVNEFKAWLRMREKFHWNTHTIITTSIVSILFLYLLLPTNQTVKMPGTISYIHRFLIAPEEGYIDSDIPAEGSKIIANKPIIIIKSPNLNEDLKTTYLEYEKSVSELRRSAVDPKFNRQQDVLLSEILKQKSKYDKLHNTIQTLTISVPFNGVLVELAADLKKGNWVMKNEWLGDVILPNMPRIEAFAIQEDVNYLQRGLTGYFYPKDISYSRIPIRVDFIEVLNSNELNCNFSQELKQSKSAVTGFVETPCYNASDLGGEIATYQTEEGKYVPIRSVYRVVMVTTKPVSFPIVLRGTAVINTEARSYIQRLFYFIKKSLIEQSGF